MGLEARSQWAIVPEEWAFGRWCGGDGRPAPDDEELWPGTFFSSAKPPVSVNHRLEFGCFNRRPA
jgi:hypothetical protein